MEFVRILLWRCAAFFRGYEFDKDLDEELLSHIDLSIEENLKRGMSKQEARTAALREFGGVMQAKERYRVESGLTFCQSLVRDFRFANRQLRRSPGFMLTVIMTLALGIGSTSVIFSIVDRMLLRPLPFNDPDRLVYVWGRLKGIGLVRDQNGISPPEYTDIRTRNRVFDEVAAHDSGSVTLTGEGEAERLEVASVTASFFPLLGVQPAMGRTFSPDEDRPGSSDVVVMSHDLWKGRFAGDPRIVGRQIHLDGVTRTVIGVMPTGFELFGHPDLWLPIAFTSNQLSENERGSHYLEVVARVRKGVSVHEMQLNLDQIANELFHEHPENYPVETGWGIGADLLDKELTYGTRPIILLLAGAVSLLLWIACANVANLLLARGSTREPEMAIRRALGARRAQLLQQLLTESMLIAIAAGLVGLVIAWSSVAILPKFLPALPKIQLDERVLGFSILTSLMTSLIFGLVPALEASRPNEATPRLTSGRRTRRMRNIVVASEIALSVVLLAGAGLLIKSFARLLSVDPGFNPQGTLAMSVTLPDARYATDHQAAMFYRRAVENVKTIPGVDSAGFVALLPLGGRGSSGCIDIQDHPSDPSKKCPEADRRPVTADYFRAMGIPLVKGRYFDAHDDAEETPRVAIVDETLAAQFWPGKDPIGKRIKTGSDKPWVEVVGVVRHIRNRDLADASRIQVYWPSSQGPWSFGSLVVHTKLSNPKMLTGPVERAVHTVDPEIAVYNVRTVSEILAKSVAQRKITMALLVAFSTLAALLAAVGIYSVMAYLVTQRTNEMGIRIALGAQRKDILALIVGSGMKLTCLGIGMGLTAGLVLTRLMGSLLFGVSPNDLLTFCAVAGLLLLVGLTACYIPARRAMLIEPTQALRAE